MEKRKTIELGRSTLVVSLPSTWVKKVGLKSGEYLNLEEGKDASLYLSPSEIKQGLKEKEITVSEEFTKEGIAKLIESAYCAGYDSIKIVCKDSSKIGKIIQETVSDLMGVEIINQGENFFVIKDIGGGNSENLDNLVRRAFFLVMSISTDSLEAFKSGKKDIFEDLAMRDVSVDRICFFCLRHLNKAVFKQEKIPAAFSFIMLTERLSDLYARICNLAPQFKEQKLKEEIVDLWDHTNCIVRHIFENYSRQDFKKFLPLFNKKAEIKKITEKLIDKANENNTVKLIFLFSMIVEMCCELMFAELIKEA